MMNTTIGTNREMELEAMALATCNSIRQMQSFENLNKDEHIWNYLQSRAVEINQLSDAEWECLYSKFQSLMKAES